MKHTAFAACLLVCAVAFLGGCSTDEYAKAFLARDTTAGKLDYAFLGDTDRLVEQRIISHGRVVKMSDKVKIDVWVIKAKTEKARGTVMAIHDLGASKNAYRSLANLLAEKGFDVVLPDLRAHGRSTGKYVTYGALEKRDLKRVMDVLLADKVVAAPLYVFGTGLGGSVALQYAAVDSRVKGVMALAATRDIHTEFTRFINDIAVLMSPEDRVKTLAAAGKLGKFRIEDASALVAARKLKCPVYLMHGKADLRTPHAESQAVYKALAGPKELELVPLLRRLGVLFAPDASLVDRIEKVAGGKVGAPAK